MSAGDAQDTLQSATPVEMAQQIRINTERVIELRRRVTDIESAHQAILWMLIINLGTALGGLATFLLSHRLKRRDDERG